MELTERERQLIEVAKEEILLMIPEVIGNQMANHAALNKIRREFYKDHPEFKDHRDSVMSVVEMIEGKNPLADYKEIFEKAVPEIGRRIKTLKKLDMKNVTSKPNLEFKDQHGKL